MSDPAPTTAPVGRDHELNMAGTAVLDGCGVLLTGTPGVGKTHLARRVVEHLGRITTIESTQFASAADPGGIADITGPPNRSTGTHLIVIEDAHLLGTGDLDHLLTDCRNGRLRLIATGLDVQGTPARLVRDGVLVHVRLAPLNHLQTAQLVREHLGGPVTADVIRYVWQTSAGNPRYAIDIVESVVAEGQLVLTDGTWLLTGVPAPGSRILAQVDAELARCTPAERDVVDLVALGGAVPLDALLATIDDVDVLDTLVGNDLLVMGTDENTGGALVRTAHPRFGDLAAMLVPPARRHALFTRMFPTHALPPGPAEHLLHSARWGLSAAVSLSADGLLDAARAAASLGRLDATDQLTTAALTAFGPRAPARVEALLLRSAALRTSGRTAEAIITAEAARVEVDTVDLPASARPEWSRRATVAQANLAQFGRGDTDFALALIHAESDRHVEGPGPDATTAARLRADRSMRLAYGARFDEAEAVPLSSTEVADLPTELRIDRDVGLIHAHAFRGSLEEARVRAVRLAEEGFAGVDEAPWAPLQTQSLLFMVLLWLGDVQTVKALVDSVDTHPDTPGFVDPAVRQLGWGRIAGTRGAWSEAAADLDAAVARFRMIDFSGWLALASSWSATALAASGDSAGAAAALATARQTPLRASGILVFELWDHWWRTALALGSPAAADIAHRLVDQGRDRSLGLVELWGWHALVCCAPSTVGEQAGQRIDELTEHVQGPLAAARAEHARALLTGDETLAAAAFTRLSELGHWMPVDHIPAVATLTARQLEVARLAVSGLSSTAIAERLYISKRTVDSHLGNVYERLGIRSRTDLRAVLAVTDPR